MRAYRWIVLGAMGVGAVAGAVIACGSKNGGSYPGDDGGPTTLNDAGEIIDPGTTSTSSGGGSGLFQMGDGGGIMVADSQCKAGRYEGAFAGSYSSGLIAGIPLNVTGDVNLTLNQEGDAGSKCVIAGEGFELCSEVFTLSGGTITGTADKAGMLGDATIGGFPYFCTLTGTLDCVKKSLVNGWIQCTYCVGPLADGGDSCTIGIGGHFAGPLTSDYFYSTGDGGPPAFGTAVSPDGGGGSDPGHWNGAEALAGNNGMMPGPDGGPISEFLALDGGYGFLGKYGGAGIWSAQLQ